MFNPFNFINKKVGLVLGSGGAKGISHIAVIEYINELGIPIDMIAGASISALVGALYCTGSLQNFKKDLLSMDRKTYLDFFDPIFPVSGLLGSDSIIKFIQKYIPENLKFEDLKIPLNIVATDYQTGKPIVFSSGNIVQAIRASISIPGIFTPVPYGDTFLIDGGVANPLPIDVTKSMGAGLIVAVNLHPSVKPKIMNNEKIKSLKKQAPKPEKNDEKQSYVGLILEKAKNIAQFGKNTWLKYLSSYMNNEKVQDRKKLPNIFDIIFQSIDIMGYTTTAMMLKYDPPAVLIEPNLLDFKSMDFSRGIEALNEGRNACDLVKNQLNKLPRNKKRSIV